MDLDKPSRHLPTLEKLPFFSFPLFTKRDASHATLIFSLLTVFVVSYKIISPFQFVGIDLLSQIIPKNDQNAVEVCEYSNGEWVWDETYPRQKYTEKCPFLDPGFRCQQSGRPDLDYQKWRWQPKGCDLPRFNAAYLLERIRNRKIVFSGDSIARNQWESLLCMLSQGVSNKSTIYEVNGSPITKHKGSLSFRFQAFNLTVEYYRTPFLVAVDRPPPNASKEVARALRVDKLHRYSSKWIGADILVFSAGHWWNQAKTSKMGIYFQEGKAINMSMDALEAFQRSLNTLKSWIMQNSSTRESRIFFVSYSPSHYGGGAWNVGGHCHTNRLPEKNPGKLEPEPLHNIYVSDIVKQIGSTEKSVRFLNITYLTEFRNDGHPSKHREPGTPLNGPQDCSHWCLPGIPDTWNELLYAYLISEEQRNG